MDKHTPLMHPDELEHEIDLIVERIGGLDHHWCIPIGRYLIKLADDEEWPLRRVIH